MLDDNTAKQNIATNVRRLRAGRPLAWLAREVGTYPINIQRIEEGHHMPGAGLLGRIAEALDTSMDSLIAAPVGNNLEHPIDAA